MNDNKKTRTGSNDAGNDEEFTEISKSQLKREAKAITKLGKHLMKLSANELKHLDLPDFITDELTSVKKVKPKSSAIKRSILHLGKVLRNYENIEELIYTVDHFELTKKNSKQKLDYYCEKLLENDKEFIESTLGQYADLDRQKLRQLIRNSKPNIELENAEELTEQDKAQGKKLRNYLSQYIK